MSDEIVDNIIIDDSMQIINAESEKDLILFSTLKADTQPIVPYELKNFGGIDYPQYHSSKCAICNSPYRTLLEHVYIDSNKRVNSVIHFFEKHFGAKLNWAQIKQHVKFHADFTKIEKQGLKDYEFREEELSKWKYREYELALIAILVEIDDVRGINARTPDEILKRASVIDKLMSKLIAIKQHRDEHFLGLPNVFEVLAELHEKMVNDEDKRIIREKGIILKQSLS